MVGWLALTPWLQAAEPLIRPGELWPDNRGQHVQAHGGGILKYGDTYYWFGEDRSETNSTIKRCVACYASTNLAQWTFRNQVVHLTDPEKLGHGWVLERPKVFYNGRTKKFVMYAHIDSGSYQFASVAVFTCDTAGWRLRVSEKFSAARP